MWKQERKVIIIYSTLAQAREQCWPWGQSSKAWFWETPTKESIHVSVLTKPPQTYATSSFSSMDQ